MLPVLAQLPTLGRASDPVTVQVAPPSEEVATGIFFEPEFVEKAYLSAKLDYRAKFKYDKKLNIRCPSYYENTRIREILVNNRTIHSSQDVNQVDQQRSESEDVEHHDLEFESRSRIQVALILNQEHI